MEILNKLSPAETYLIRATSDATFKDLLKYTLSDLLLKKVLHYEERILQSNEKSPERMVSYISTGENFLNYDALKHEVPFLKAFFKNPEIDIMFRHIVKMGYDEAGSKNNYIFTHLLSNPLMKEKVKGGVINRLFNRVRLTDLGIRAKSQINDAFEKLEIELPTLLEKSPEKALELLKKINGNVFLIEGIDFEQLIKVDSEITDEINRQNQSSSYLNPLMYFTSESFPFDSDFDSADGCGSGCSSCSGCSGCGGCGGCG
ncbi:hypothetical protein JMN32_06850 [Fulvivirga sp. 29W222]|uniref:Uncharacterized protein n=1 Tax=Fulvivirga marina TaxID=2494733 RepID=A0A937FU11_9BACT|nr:hypothetical protein [Fulvivirga marina]MBL6446020.1 hypothetical protein [Fulvivirga marina]